jgi:hypothetical protein
MTKYTLSQKTFFDSVELILELVNESDYLP